MFKLRRLHILLIAATLTPIDGRSQQPAARTEQEGVVRISTQLVQLDVVVTDKKGKHIEDLSAGDFELLVDGKKQSLTHFSHFNLAGVRKEIPTRKPKETVVASESMPTRQIASEEVKRTLAFIVDDLGLSFQSTELVRETLRKFVAEQMQPGDLVAIIRTGNGLGMLEQFTSDKRILYSAIERLVWNPFSRDMMPSFAQADSGEEATEEQLAAQTATSDFNEFITTSYSTGTLGAINFVVKGLRALPGRKSVVLLSDGFRINSTNNNDNSSEQIRRNLEYLVEEANRSSVVVYAIDAKGLQPYMPGPSQGGRPSASSYSDAQQSAQEALEGPTFLAQQTGGFMVVNTNDLNIGIDEALYDQQSYYLLGFDPEDEKFDRKFHKIKVNVTRPGLKIRTRSGFFGVNEEERSTEPREKTGSRGQQILAALSSPLGARDLSLQMTPYFFNSIKEGSFVRALFHIDCSKLTFKDVDHNKKKLNLDLAAFAFDETGLPVDLAMRRIELELDENQYRKAIADGLAYRADFALKKPGAYQFRAVLRDSETGLAGSASQFIRVPDLEKKRLALSGLVITSPKPDSQNDPISISQTADLQSSPYLRTFDGSGSIQYGAVIYNAALDKKSGQPKLSVKVEIYHEGKVMRQFPARSIDVPADAKGKNIDFVSKLKLINLPPGEYLMRLTVTDNLASKKYSRADQWMDFKIQ